MKKRLLLTILLSAILIFPSFAEAGNKATVFHPITGHRKVVTVGDPFAFAGGYMLEIAQVRTVPEGTLGYTVVTDYSVTLSSSINATTAILPVSSMTTKDSHTLTMGDIGTKVFLVIEPGGNKEEIVLCTGISGTSWTGCTRGLAFYGTSTAAVTANQKTHSAGSRVIISNTHYVYDELVDKDASETIGGNKTYTGSSHFYILPTATTTAGTDANQLITLGQAQTLANQGAATSSDTIAGIAERATKAEISAGTSFDINNPHYISSEHATSSSDVATTSAVITKSNGKIAQNFLDLSENFAFTNDVTIDSKTISSSSFSKFGGTGLDGALDVTSGTTTLDAGSLTVLTKNYSSINIAAGATTTISTTAASGTLLILKSTGDCTIAGVIDLRGKGATSTVSGATAYQNTGVLDDSVHGGAYGTNATDSSTVGTGGAAGAIYSNKFLYPTANSSLYRKLIAGAVGSGGGQGGAGWHVQANAALITGGLGGHGGGAIILECGGTLTFTGRILVDGEAGKHGHDAATDCALAIQNCAGGSGGGGGSAGMALIIYNNISTNTGTISASGGAGGDGGNSFRYTTGTNAPGGSGAGGGAWSSAGGAGVNGCGNSNCAGTAGNAGGLGAGGSGGGGASANGGGAGAPDGGAGGAGGASDPKLYLITKNYDF